MEKIKFKEVFEAWKKEKKMYVKLSTYSAYCLLCENHLIPAFWEVYDITDEDDKKYNKLILDTPKTKESIRDTPLSSDLVKFFIPISSK